MKTTNLIDTKEPSHRNHRSLGASMVEYALLLVLIALACIAALESLGGNVSETFSVITSTIDDVD